MSYNLQVYNITATGLCKELHFFFFFVSLYIIFRLRFSWILNTLEYFVSRCKNTATHNYIMAEVLYYYVFYRVSFEARVYRRTLAFSERWKGKNVIYYYIIDLYLNEHSAKNRLRCLARNLLFSCFNHFFGRATRPGVHVGYIIIFYFNGT